MANRARPGFCGPLIIFVAALRQQPRVLAAPTFDQHFTFVPHENNAVFRIKVTALLQFGRPLRQESPVIPMQLHRRHFSRSGKLVMHTGGEWHRFFEYGRRTGGDRFRSAKLQRSENRSQVMNAHVAKSAGTEIPPTAPAKWSVRRMIWPRWGGPKPQIPIHRLGNCRCIFWPLDALGPPQRHLAAMCRAIGPDMHFAHRANRAIVEPFVNEPVALERHPLVAHLRGDLRLAGHFGHSTRLLHRSG